MTGAGGRYDKGLGAAPGPCVAIGTSGLHPHMVGPWLQVFQTELGGVGFRIRQGAGETIVARDLQMVVGGLRLGRPAQREAAVLGLWNVDAWAGKHTAKGLGITPGALALGRVNGSYSPLLDTGGQVLRRLGAGTADHLLVHRCFGSAELHAVLQAGVALGPA